MRRTLALGGIIIGAAVACANGIDEGTQPGPSTLKEGSTAGNTTFGSEGDGSVPCFPNKENYEIPGNGCDDDADGTVDNEDPSCDSGLDKNGDAEAFARAIGLCKKAGARGSAWGLVSARFTNGFSLQTAPHERQHGILQKFGSVIRPRKGSAIGVLSTGYASEFNGDQNKNMFKASEDMQQQGATPAGEGALPAGFPKPSTDCPGGEVGAFDVAVFEAVIKVPKNARGFSFNFNFYTSEWPDYICTPYNDSFIAMVTSQAFPDGAENVSFDKDKNPITVNNGFFDRCTPETRLGCSFRDPNLPPLYSECPGGSRELEGTGYGSPLGKFCGPSSTLSTPGGATGWLKSESPAVAGEEVKVQFIISDTDDFRLDSSVLIDKFEWEQGPIVTGTSRIK